jgi:hypothetical protein
MYSTYTYVFIAAELMASNICGNTQAHKEQGDLINLPLLFKSGKAAAYI